MIPTVIHRQLARLRRRERLLDLAWGAARLLALAVTLLILAGAADWLIDREQDTPEDVRLVLSYFQIGALAAAAFFFLLWPLRKSRPDSALALCVEEKHPRLRHRLISAVQLNQPGADIEGMSEELIGVVTQEAVTRVRTIDVAAVADKGRLRWAAALVLPTLALAAAPFLLWPKTASALLARQFGADRDIPRDVTIEAITPSPWASGEKGVLKFKAKGKNLDELAGAAVVRPEGLAADRYPLELDPNWKQGDEEALFTVQMPPSSTNFSYTAWLGDGRTKKPAHVRYVPRPVVIEQTAWVWLPAFCGTRPDGSRYEQLQGRGEILGILGSSARVVVKIQKPIKSGWLELLGPEKPDAEKSPEEIGPEAIKRTVQMAPDQDGSWQGTFDLRPDETGYRVVVADEYGFENVPAPRRSVRLVPEEPPQVALLKEQFPPTLRAFLSADSDDFVVEGLPLPLGGAIPIAYTASGPYGLGQARLLFRVVKKVESGNDDPGEEKWIPLPLQEVAGNDKVGPFDPRLGAFANSAPREQIYFHAIEGGTPLPRTLGGGRFDFKTTGIPDGKGGLLELKVGDQVEYCIEVFADKDGKTNRPSARSETRVKTIVSFGDLERWLTENLQEAQRIRQLDAKQRGLFGDN
jgi:hypothetical protein